MKTNLSFLRNSTHIFFLATVTLVLLSARRTTFAGSATWDSSSLLNTDWNTNGNWSRNTGYPGTGVGDTATFDNLSSTTSLFVSSSITIAAIDFTASETHAFTITVDPTITLTISGTGITNGSGITQNFVTAVDGSGNEGFIAFTNGATAGSMTSFTNNGGTVSGASGGFTRFNDTSTAGSATLIANGGTVSGASGGRIVFSGTSTGGMASVDVERSGPGTPGNLDISLHTGGVTIGSLQGNGDVFLGGNNLSVGSNNLSKTFSGMIQNGGISGGTGGSLTKTGTGTFTLTGVNTYTGGTTVNAGSLFVNNTTGPGTGIFSVTVNSEATLGGNGTTGPSTAGVIAEATGAVTVNSGATLAPGPTGNGSTGILNTGALTLASGSNFSVALNVNV